MKKLSKKCLFVQDTGIFTDEFVVAIGYNHAEILEELKQIKATKEVFDFVRSTKQKFEEYVKGNSGGVFFNEEGKAILMHFQKWSDTWDFWEVLLHECCHVVQGLEDAKNIIEEVEARAYTTQYLFRKIRRKLSGAESL